MCMLFRLALTFLWWAVKERWLEWKPWMPLQAFRHMCQIHSHRTCYSSRQTHTVRPMLLVARRLSRQICTARFMPLVVCQWSGQVIATRPGPLLRDDVEISIMHCVVHIMFENDFRVHHLHDDYHAILMMPLFINPNICDSMHPWWFCPHHWSKNLQQYGRDDFREFLMSMSFIRKSATVWTLGDDSLHVINLKICKGRGAWRWFSCLLDVHVIYWIIRDRKGPWWWFYLCH